MKYAIVNSNTGNIVGVCLSFEEVETEIALFKQYHIYDEYHYIEFEDSDE